MKDTSVISSEKHDKAVMRIVEKLAYSIGAFLGDGSARFVPGYGNGSWYVTEVSTMDPEVPNRVADEINAFFGTNYKPFKRILKTGQPFYIFRANRAHVHHLFVNLTDYRTRVPKEIFSSSTDVVRDFLAGILDTDGSVAKTRYQKYNGYRYQLKFSNTSKAMVEGVASLLQRLGVKVGRIQETQRGGYRTIYSIQPNIKTFFEAGCYLNVGRKLQRLNEYFDVVLGSETMHAAPATSGEDIVRPLAKA